jgi:N-methylhydantoinase A
VSKAKAKKTARESIRIAVDIGGTFTDGLAVIAPGNRIWVGKTLTTPDDPGIAVTTVMADLLKQIAAARGEGPRPVTDVVHGTTLVTNTLIERKGARTGLVVTQGTRDVLTIAREIRYDLYDLNLEIPQPLVPEDKRVEAVERLDVSGAVVTQLTSAEVERVLDELEALNVEAIAVCLLHAYVNDVHEKQIAAAVKKRFPGLAISISSGIAREIREYERMSTTVANAYVQPLMTEYLNRPRPARARSGARRTAEDHGVERWLHLGRGGSGYAHPAARIRPRRRRAVGAQHRAQYRHLRNSRVRHGRHHRQGLRRGRRRAADRAQFSSARACRASSAARGCRY